MTTPEKKDFNDEHQKVGAEALAKSFAEFDRQDKPHSKAANDNALRWTNDTKQLIAEIIAKADKVKFVDYARSLGDITVMDMDALPLSTLQIILAKRTNELITEMGLAIGQLPTMTDKDPKTVLLFNGRYWQKLYFSQIKDLIKGITIKAGLVSLKYQTPRFNRGLLDTLYDSLPLTPEPVINRVLLNLANCTLEFMPNGTTKLHKHASNDFIQHCLHYDYNPDAKAPMFLKFIHEILPDTESRTVLQELIGAIFIQHLKFEKIGILLGSGSNGKSVFLSLIKAMLGEANVSSMSLKDLTSGDKAPNNRAQLIGKKLNIAAEIDSKGIQDHAMIKTLASREPTTFKWLYQDTFTTDLYAMLLFACNGLPRDVEHTLGFFRRLLLVAFDQTITEDKQDRELATKIIASELSGILNWAIEGFKRMCANKQFSLCKKSDILLSEYKLDTDSVATFIKEFGYIPHQILTKEFGDIFNLYKGFCSNDLYKPVGTKEFGKRLRSLTFKITKGGKNKTYIYMDIKLESDEYPEK